MNKLVIALCILSLLMFSACENFSKSTETSLAEVDRAIADFDLVLAEKLLDRILKEETNSQDRYQAYLKLIELSQNIYTDQRWTIEYLEAMAEEFTSDAELEYILYTLAAEYEKAGDNQNANKVLFRMLDELELDKSKTADIYSQLAKNYFLSSEFALAEDMAIACISNAADYQAQVQCSYLLVQIYSINSDTEKVQKLAEAIYNNPETQSELKAYVGMVWADSLELQEKNQEALKIYQEVLEIHPNKKVVEMRIASLKK